jgi:hypothetical protein
MRSTRRRVVTDVSAPQPLLRSGAPLVHGDPA